MRAEAGCRLCRGTWRRRALVGAALCGLFLVAAAGCVDAANGVEGRAGNEGARGAFTVGTFNIHYTAPWQDRMAWEERRASVLAMLEDAEFDLLAFQEMETFEGGHFNEENRQLDFIAARFPEYAFAAVGKPEQYPSTQPVMYRRERFEVLAQGFFFFSPDPDEIYSRSWDGGFPAFCSWVRFRDLQSDGAFYLYNVHLDHSSRGNRIKSAELIAGRVTEREHTSDPVIVVGDFNAPWFFRPVRIVAEAGLDIADTTGSTFHFFRGINVLPAIDHVLVSQPFEPQDTRVLRRSYEDTWPSDHYPVLVTVSR